MAWCYLHVGRLDDVRELLAVADRDPAVEAVRYAMRPLDDHLPPGAPAVPAASGDAADALLLRACYHLGRLAELADEPASRWVEAVTGPWRIGALRATGRIRRALELYESAQAAGVAAVGLHALVGPEVLIDAGREAEAREALARGRDVARRSGSLIFELFNGLVAAKLELRLARDPRAARRILDRLENELGARAFPHIREMLDMWYALALLIEGEDADAVVRLRQAVAGMLEGDRLLELPTAAVHLAEAEWRAGEEERADRAADLAVEAARRQGSNHTLITALADFPAVVARRIDAEPGVDSIWHELGRALLAQDVALGTDIAPTVVLDEFGSPSIEVDGEPVRPRIVKSYELLALLAHRHPMPLERDELLDALFGARADDSTRAYLRQAIHQLRQVLPAPDPVVSENGHVQLAEGLHLTTASQRFERELAEAARLRGEERLEATLAALRAPERGEYLAGVDSAWAEQRRRHLADLEAAARYEAAELAFSTGRLDEAQRLAHEVLRAEPYREGAWRLTMRIANALGDDHGVLVAFRSCQEALGPLGIEPSHGTRQLLDRLRR
jgi:DNA-binding SARP family transcriptional activator